MNNPASTAAAAPAQTPPPGTKIFDSRFRITVLSPCYDYSLTEYYHNAYTECKRLTAWFRQPDGSVREDTVIAGRLSLPNDSHIDRARNILTNMWERENQTDLCYWWDVDIPANPQDILRLFLHAAAGKHFVCGLYAMKCLTPTFVANVVSGARPDPETGLIELQHGGTGSMLWHRDVLTTLRRHSGVKPYRCAANTPWPGETFYAYFTSGVYGVPEPGAAAANWQSEDWMVCEMWRELGGQVWGDTQVKLRHLGRLLFPPLVAELEDATIALLTAGNPHLNRERFITALDLHAKLIAAKN